jgi:hypothetical protein
MCLPFAGLLILVSTKLRCVCCLQVCWDGGDLVCCDQCPAAYHADCLGLGHAELEAVPTWACPQHRCGVCQRKAGVSSWAVLLVPNS